MSISFPTSLDSFANPVGTDLLENATAALDHDVQHSNANDAIEALEAKVGINGSAVTTSHDYKLSGITGSDKALSSGAGGGAQTITDLTLVDPIFTLGGDATGDMFYRNSGGVITRLPIGTANQIIQTSAGGIPEWIANPAASDASTTVKGVVEEATQAEVDAGTGTGSTGARLFVNPSTLAGSTVLQSNGVLQYGGTGADGALTVTSGITNIDLGSSQYFIKNYTTISITGTGQVKFINPHASGTIIFIKCQGLATFTSSTIPNLDASGCGGAGGAGGTVAGTKTGSNGTNGTSILDASIHYGAGASSNSATTGGLILSSTTLPFYTRNDYQLMGGIKLACGSGGGGGGATDGNGTGGAVTGTADGGAGGNGGAVLLMQCGSLNFTSTLGISVAGAAGTVGGTISSAAGANGVAGSGGGGGAGGMCVILYNTLVAASGTINSAGGSGGAGGAASNTSGAGGGGTIVSLAAGAGAGAYGGAGGNGGASVSPISTNGTNGSAAGGVQAGGGGGSGAGIIYITSATNTGGTGGAGGASAGGVIAKNYLYS